MKNRFDLVVDRLRENSVSSSVLCSDYWRKVLQLQKDFDESEAWKFFFDNFTWLINTKTLKTREVIEWFDKEQLEKVNIYTKGKHEIKDGQAVGIGNADLSFYGHSRGVLFDRAKATGYDSSFLTFFDRSRGKINSCIGEAFGKSNVIAGAFSRLEAFDKSIVSARYMSMIIINGDEVNLIEELEGSKVVRLKSD